MPSHSRQHHRAGLPVGWRAWLAAAAAAALVLLLATAPAAAQEIRTWSKKASFEDAKFDLTNAITNRGLVIDSVGNVGAMLERTGKDVGSTKPIYRGAEYMAFCSAKLSRDLMEGDPLNLAHCPFVMFIYESVAKPGEVVIGYRRPAASGSAASRKALEALDALLESIAKEAAKPG